MSRLLVSVRGPKEAVVSAEGGAHIADVEHPSSALGTPYPLNIKAVRNRLNRAGYPTVPISTNIGEEQAVRSAACQAALGVAVAGADYVKCGLAGLDLRAAAYLTRNLVRTVKEWCPEARVFPAVFPEEEFALLFHPVEDAPRLVEETGCDGVLIDTLNKEVGRGLLGHLPIEVLTEFVESMHALGKEAWLAGSLTRAELPGLWAIGADVICVRSAACESGAGEGRFGDVTVDRVRSLVSTIP